MLSGYSQAYCMYHVSYIHCNKCVFELYVYTLRDSQDYYTDIYHNNYKQKSWGKDQGKQISFCPAAKPAEIS